MNSEEKQFNLKLIEKAAVKAENGDFKSVLEMHEWLFKNGFRVSEKDKLQLLQQAEQMDAETGDTKKPHIVNIPDVGQAVHFGTDEEAAEHERKLTARGEFAKAYMREKGWPDKMLDLTIEQIMEIREQDGWKSP